MMGIMSGYLSKGQASLVNEKRRQRTRWAEAEVA